MWPFKAKNKRARDKPDDPRIRVFKSVSRPRADATLQGSEAIYAAVSRISSTVASMPMHLYQGYERMDGDPRERLVSLEPAPNFTAYTWRQTMEVLRNIEGTAYALIVPDGSGTPTRLDILNPARVRPMRDPETLEIWYQIMMDDEEPQYAPGGMVLAIKHMSANGERGIRPVDVLRSSLDYDAQVRQLSLDQLEGVNHGLMLTVPNTSVNEERKNAIVDRFLETYKRSGRSVVVLEGGLTATTFSTSPVDAQLLDVERISRNRVATVYKLPPHMLGDYTDTSFSTAEQQMQEFLQLTITPIVEQWEEEFNRKLLSRSEYAAGYRYRFDTDALTRADTATMANKHQIAIRGGWLKPNEVRAREGMPPDPSGNELMASRDLIPIRIAVEHPELLLGGQAPETKEDKQ